MLQIFLQNQLAIATHWNLAKFARLHYAKTRKQLNAVQTTGCAIDTTWVHYGIAKDVWLMKAIGADTKIRWKTNENKTQAKAHRIYPMRSMR
jgi:hypothetical protein